MQDRVYRWQTRSVTDTLQSLRTYTEAKVRRLALGTSAKAGRLFCFYRDQFSTALTETRLICFVWSF